MKRSKFQQACLAFVMLILSVFLITGCGSNNETGHWLPAPESEKALVSIQVTPATASIPVGAPKQFIATAIYDDGTSADVTVFATWTSGSTGIATVNSASGLAAGVAPGTAIITADYGGKSDSATLTVMSAEVTLSSIVVTPATASAAIGEKQAFVATGHYSDGTSHDISSTSTWTSGTPGVATVISTSGLATGVATGTAIITATFGGKSGSATLTILPPSVTLSSIEVTPATASIPKGTTQRFVATGHYSNGTSKDISIYVIWTSSATGVATVVSPGIATGLSVGTTTITATLDCGTCETNKSGSATLTVTAATLMRLVVTPATASVAIGGNRAFVATGYYSDGTSAIITTSVIWSPGTPSIATVGATTGVATGVSVGSTHITATSGSLSSYGVLTVNDPQVPGTPSCAGPGPVDMGSAASFAVLVGPAGGATFTITNPMFVTGNTGAKSYVPASGVSNLTSGYTQYTGTAAPYVAAMADMLIAISCASQRACTVTEPDGAFDFGGKTLAPGVYCVNGAMSVDSDLTISTPGVYIFRSSGALDTAVNVNVTFGGTANATNTWLFWVPSGAATIKAGTAFIGTIMPDSSAASTMNATATLIPGRLFSNSDVTVNTNTITIP